MFDGERHQPPLGAIEPNETAELEDAIDDRWAAPRLRAFASTAKHWAVGEQPHQEVGIMKHHTIAGGGGSRLHVVEAGNTRGRPICSSTASRSAGSPGTVSCTRSLADRYRLVAMDMRGHGCRKSPTKRYADSKLWADDVGAVIQALNLDHPVLCGGRTARS